jgi:tetratricopeptide (TPR) repeat protein
MTRAKYFMAAMLAAAGAIGFAGATLAPVSAVAADKEQPAAAQKIGAKMSKPLKAAQDAIGQKQWDAAMASLEEAAAIEPKTSYEQWVTNEMTWFVYLQKKDYAKAATLIEQQLSSEFMPPADLPQRLKTLSQLNYQIQNYPKAVEFGNKYLATNATDADIGLLVAQSYYLQKDFQNAKATSEKFANAGGAKPNEQMLLLLLRSSFELKDRPATVKALEALVTHYPKHEYWEDLLNNVLFQTKTDRELRALYRLIDETGTLDKGEEYTEMAGVVAAAGFPTEALKVLERGKAANAYEGDDKGRAEAAIVKNRAGADADRKDLATAEKSLAAAKSGNEMVAIGKLYFSVGQYDKAADAIQKGLAKGGVTDLDDANALLGISRTRMNDAAGAAQAFDAIKDPNLADIGRLWKLYNSTKSAAPAAAAAS